MPPVVALQQHGMPGRPWTKLPGKRQGASGNEDLVPADRRAVELAGGAPLDKGRGHSSLSGTLLAFHLPEAELTECYQTN